MTKITPSHFVRLGEDNPHCRAYDEFRAMLFAYLKARHGRQQQLANHLRLSRQTAHRYFACPHISVPAWVALSANVWLHRQLTMESRNALLSLVRPPGERHQAPRSDTKQPTQLILK